MCSQNLCLHLSAKESDTAVENLLVYCKPVELYNILHRRVLHNSLLYMLFGNSCSGVHFLGQIDPPSFLRRCLKYKCKPGIGAMHLETVKTKLMMTLQILKIAGCLMILWMMAKLRSSLCIFGTHLSESEVDRVLADGHVSWACEAFSKLHGLELVRSPALFWCWRIFMIKLWNHGLLSAYMRNNCSMIFQRCQNEELDAMKS